MQQNLIKPKSLNSKRVIITGGPGFGKTSVIDELESRNYPCKHEVSRTIIKEQLEIGGDILPWKNLASFSKLLMESRIKQFEEVLSLAYTFFDRGLPDIIAYMQKDKLFIPDEYATKVKESYYFSKVFIVPPWKEIYHNDGERKEDYDTACMINDLIIRTYQDLGYQTVILPKISIKERTDFILNEIGII